MKKISFKELIEQIQEVFQKAVRSAEGKRRGAGSVLLPVILTLVAAFAYFFFLLPPLNLQSPQFYSYFLFILVVFFITNMIFGGFKGKNYIKATIILGLVCLLLIPVGSFFAGPVFRAKSHAALIKVENGVFDEDVEKISFDQIPIVDKETAAIIGSKQMGVMADLVSQFEIDDNYAQINVKGKPIRVSPLKYSDIFKYLKNYKNGIPSYVNVDMTKQEAKVERLKNTIKYSNSDYLMRDINRHLRFSYPFDIFGEINFELDDDYNPYYVTPVLHKPIGFFGGLDVKAVIVTNASTGESTKYSVGEVPDWVDRVYPPEIIVTQLDNRGMYSGGFLNSIFGQTNVTHTTKGYNYVSIGEDIFLTTGVTSIKSDESNLGFYFCNLRTKETKFYPCPSATEIAAMQSAQGKVQEKGYDATFPVILNISDQPVYFMALKDKARTAKMFAIVDAQQYTDAIIGNSVMDVLNNYLMANPGEKPVIGESGRKKVTVQSVHTAVIDGNTYYYLKIREDSQVYVATAKELGSKVVFVKQGDVLNILGYPEGNEFFIKQIVEE